MAPLLTRIFPAASRLTVIGLSRVSPPIERLPEEKFAVIAIVLFPSQGRRQCRSRMGGVAPVGCGIDIGGGVLRERFRNRQSCYGCNMPKRGQRPVTP